MKTQTIINVLLSVAIVASFLFGFFKENPKTEQAPINYDLYEFRFKQMEGQIDSLKSQYQTTDYEITKDSLLVVGAPRSKRDSLRAIINPR